jgi:hypothetical protein
VDVYFSDFFECAQTELESYGALDISLVADLPLFVDPFLLFNSSKPEYQKLHEEMIEYMRFLKAKADSGTLSGELIKSWYVFSEVKQNWLGYSLEGNKGRGLGPKFAQALHSNLHTVFKDFGNERVTKGRHIEKLCLIRNGVGRDNISDFATNLIKHFLLDYTAVFAHQYIDPRFTKKLAIPRVAFNYRTESWETQSYILPWYVNDYVLLTPEDILTRDDTWINQQDLYRRYEHIAESIPNDQLRGQLNNYFHSALPKKTTGPPPTAEEKHAAILRVLQNFPQVVDYYIRDRENHGEEAAAISAKKVNQTKGLFIGQVRLFRAMLHNGGFYSITPDTYDAAMHRVNFLRHVIENNDGYRFFWDKDQPIERESDLKLIYRLTWFSSPYEVDTEVNNGRGPVDYKISMGSVDKTLVEFKLASNAKLEQNLQNQVEVYKKANRTKKAIKVIIFFSVREQERVVAILKRLDLSGDPSIVLIDARRDNKPSASNVKT